MSIQSKRFTMGQLAQDIIKAMKSCVLSSAAWRPKKLGVMFPVQIQRPPKTVVPKSNGRKRWVSQLKQREGSKFVLPPLVFSLDAPTTLVREFESRAQGLISSGMDPHTHLEKVTNQGFLYSVIWTPGVYHPSGNALNKVMHVKSILEIT